MEKNYEIKKMIQKIGIHSRFVAGKQETSNTMAVKQLKKF